MGHRPASQQPAHLATGGSDPDRLRSRRGHFGKLTKQRLDSAALLSRPAVHPSLPVPSQRSIKLLAWSSLLGKFVGVQAIVQVIGLCSGILLVRNLNKADYAFFTLANAMQATMTLLADVGISSGLSAIGGKVWNDRFQFGQLIRTALRIRHILVVAAIGLIGPLLLWMLLRNGCPFGYAAMISLAVLGGAAVQVGNGVLAVVPRLHLQIGRIQKLDLACAAFRLGILLLAYCLFLNAAIAVAAATVTFFAQNLILKRWARRMTDLNAPVSAEYRASLVSIIKTQAPNDIYYCIQGQITVWLITFFGNTRNIAEIGALGRLAVLFSIANSILASIVLPRFARCQLPQILRVRYWQIIGVYCAFGAFLTLIAALFPDQLLWILGRQYSHLRTEVLLIVVSTVFNGVVGAMWSLNLSKAWIPSAWLNISLVLALQVILLPFVDVSTVKGVISFNILSILPSVVLYAYVAHKGFSSGHPTA